MIGACGSSFLNDRFSEYLSTRLRGETYLKASSVTIEELLENAIVSFEYDKKRLIDVTESELQSESFRIPGLRADASKGFLHEQVLVNRYAHRYSYI